MSASLSRKTHLKIFGVPLRGWGYDNFYNIGNVFRRVMSVDYSIFNHGKVTVLTDCLFSINHKMALEIENKFHKITIFEDHHCQDDYLKGPSQSSQGNDLPVDDDDACKTPPLTPVNCMTHQIPHKSQEKSNTKMLESHNNNDPLINSPTQLNEIINNSPFSPLPPPAIPKKNPISLSPQIHHYKWA